MNVEVVIPTRKERDEDIVTLESVPDTVPVHIQRENKVTRARNLGAAKVDSEYLMFLDDDIRFSEALFRELATETAPEEVVGIRDWDFGLIVTRLTVLHTAAWDHIGGFDEFLGSHMEDTDFAIRAEKAGYDVVTLPQEVIDHIPHERSVTIWDRGWRLAYLCTKHPTYAPQLIRGIL